MVQYYKEFRWQTMLGLTMCAGSCQNINKYKNYKYQSNSGDLYNGFEQSYLHWIISTEIILEFFPH